MSFLRRIKEMSIAAGLYRPALWLSGRLRPHLQSAFDDDVAFFRSIIPEGALCFDVGANVGGKSEAMLRAGARVVSFEPSPMAIPELKARCGGYRNWTLIAAAVGANSGIGTLHAPDDSGKSSFISGWVGDQKASFHVPVITLDAAIAHFGLPHFCKIDVEGWELEVLKGLSQSPPLLAFEFHLSPANIAQTQVCLRRLVELGSAQANITPAESNRFHLPEWVPLSEMASSFPGALTADLPGDTYGDIFVRVPA